MHSLKPKLQEKSSSELATIGKKARRSRANSFSSQLDTIRSFADEADSSECEENDSEKSMSTNENSFPTASASSVVNSAEQGASPTHPSAQSRRCKGRSYEVSKHEISEIQGLTSVMTTQEASVQQLAGASPYQHKQSAEKRPRVAVSDDAEVALTPSKQSVKRCLF